MSRNGRQVVVGKDSKEIMSKSGRDRIQNREEQ